MRSYTHKIPPFTTTVTTSTLYNINIANTTTGVTITLNNTTRVFFVSSSIG